MFDYAGAIHFHSSYSYDAYVPLPEIITSALEAQLDFGILADHFKLDALKEGWERYHFREKDPAHRRTGEPEISGSHRFSDSKPFLLLVGEEISPRYNHYLALGLKEPIVAAKMHPDAQQIIDAVTAGGGFGFIAHPDHSGAPLLGVRAYPWVDWNVHGYAGMSIWDLLGDYVARLDSYPNVLRGALSPARVLRGPHPSTLERWDALNASGRCVAIGEIDNHAAKKSLFGFSKTIFPHSFAFRTIRTHVILESPLLGDLAVDRDRILTALRNGSSYISLDYWQDPRGFSFEIFDSQKRALLGQHFKRGAGAALIEAKIPGDGRVRLLRNGIPIFEDRRRHHLQRDLELPGVYRIEIEQYAAGRWRPWIFSNPIWVE